MPEGFAEVKEIVEGAMTAFEEYKKTNDDRLKQIEEKGSADPLTVDKLERIEKSMAQAEDLNAKWTKAEEKAKSDKDAIESEKAELVERLDRMETAIKRSATGGPTITDPESQKKADIFFKFCRHGKESLAPDEAKALTVSNETTGGFLAPPEYVRDIIKGVTEISPMRSVARIRNTGQRSIQHPKRTGQFAAVWVAERGTRSETAGLTYGLEEIPNHELYALVDISEQDLEDTLFDMEAELNTEFSEQFGVAEGTAFVTGNGVGKPEGVLTNSDVATTNSGSAATIADSSGQANGIIDLFYGIKTAYSRNAVFLLNRTTIGSARKLKDGNNNYIWRPGLADGVPNSILGAPYVEMPDMPNEGAGTTPIIYGDFRRGYLIVDRIVMSILRDPYTQATSGLIRFIARRRVGGQVVLVEALRKLTCAA